MAVLAPPLAAQTSPANEPGRPLPYDLGRDNDSLRSNAGALESRPVVAAANRQALAESAQGGAVLAEDQARYAADVAAYHAALREHGRDVAVSARQERAYAMAMADWRAQVDACDRGRRRACEAPAPNPADYW
ncbi:MAG: hypothetical protein EOP67_16985 [Sphingomonas sp.]|nr:MAG: hypothetical protein EOP67_16985 [Sphingomonas sp.]